MIRFGRKLVTLALASLTVTSFAQSAFTLTSNGSSAEINPWFGGVGGFFGFRDWRMASGGPNWMRQQHYFIQVDNGGIGIEAAISDPVVDQPTPDLATVTYHNENPEGNIEMSIRYLLTGAAPDSNTMSEAVTFTNLASTTRNFKIFDWVEFMPGGTLGGTGTQLNSSTLQQVNGTAVGTVGATNIPDRWMIGTESQLSSALSNGNLTNGSSPLTASNLVLAMQWNLTLAPGEHWQMGNQMIIQSAPEPASLLVLGGLAVLAARRQRNSS